MGSFSERVAKAISSAKTPSEAAVKVYVICRMFAKEAGMKPDIEVAIKRPGEPRHHDHTDCWSVVFEAGPYEWAVEASLNASGPVLAEPYYSFDLSFYPTR